MRIRETRVCLLIAGALPLLAEENLEITSLQHARSAANNLPDPSDHEETTTTSDDSLHERKGRLDHLPQHLLLNHDDDNNGLGVVIEEVEEENERLRNMASEAIHNEQFRLPPLPGKDTKHNGVVKEILAEEGNTGEMLMNVNTNLNVEGENLKEESELETDEDGEINVDVSSVHPDDETQPDTSEIDSSDDTSVGSKSEQTQEGFDKVDVPVVDSEEDRVAEKRADEVPQATHEETRTSSPVKDDADVPSNIADKKNEEDDDEDFVSRVSVDYASKSAGALIIEKAREFKGTSNLLNGDRDRYAIAPCEEKKYVVMSLSEDILVKQIKLANYERFSSSVKDFQVLGSQTLGKWFDLGTFTAKSGNGEQTFDLAEPAWARYLKFKFLSHHGEEYYCTYSQIQVHGSTMVQGFHEQWEETGSDQEEDLNIDDIDPGLMPNDDARNVTANEADGSESDVEIPVTPVLVTESSVRSSVCEFPLSNELDNKLCGIEALSDEELFSSLYDLIPSTLSYLPKESRSSLGRQTTGGMLKTIQPLGGSSMQSIYAASKQTPIIVEPQLATPSDTIVAPRMTDRLGGSLLYSLGTELGLLTARWSNPGTTTASVAENSSTDTTVHNEQDSDEPEQSVERGKDSPRDEVGGARIVPHQDGEDPAETMASEEKAAETQQDNESLPDPSVIEPALAKMLENLPSAECLSKLDFSQFKQKMMAPRKANGASGTSASSGSTPMEPIFKKLTDEIKSLQANLAVQDQFTKVSVACYQRILTDLMMETELLRTNHEDRLLKLEEGLSSSRGSYLWKILLSYYAFIHMLLVWSYSTLVYVLTPFLVCLVSLSKAGMRIPSGPFLRVVSTWGSIKEYLLHNTTGSDSGILKYIALLTAQVDRIVARMGQTESIVSTGTESVPIKSDDTWIFPMVPLILLILVGRLWMCCNSQSGKRLKLPSNSELRAWKEQSASSSPTNKSSPRHESPGKPRVKSPKKNPGQVSQPTLHIPQSPDGQTSVTSNNEVVDPVSEKPVVSPLSSPSTEI